MNAGPTQMKMKAFVFFIGNYPRSSAFICGSFFRRLPQGSVFLAKLLGPPALQIEPLQRRRLRPLLHTSQGFLLIERERRELRIQLRRPRRGEDRGPRVAKLVEQVDAAHLDELRDDVERPRAVARGVELAAGRVGVDLV